MSGRDDVPPSRDHRQLELFNPGHVFTSGDTRSVGEMLRDVDRQARDLLFDVRAEDAAPLIRGWPRLVQSAWGVWDAMPGRPTDEWAREHGDLPILRTLALSKATERAIDRRLWPRVGPTDRRLEDWAATLDRAARLVGTYGSGIPFEKPAVHADIRNARMTLLHGLYVANHATGVAVRERVRELRRDPGAELRDVGTGQSLRMNMTSNAVDWSSRLAATERVLSTHLRAGAHDTTQVGRVVPDQGDPDGLGRALVRWDVQAHRALAREASPANVYLACRGQTLIASLASNVHDIGRPPGTVDTGAAVELTSQRAWSNLAERWQDLTLPSDRAAPSLVAAAAELRTAVSTATDRIGKCRDGEAYEIATAVRAALEAAPDLAAVVHELSHYGPLRGPAKVLSRRAHDDASRDVELGLRPDSDTAWVSPVSILRKELVPLPEPSSARLREAADSVLSAARQAAPVGEPDLVPRPFPPTGGKIVTLDSQPSSTPTPVPCSPSR